MPNLSSDIVGRVSRLPLKPSQRTALLPIFEAMSNGFYAVHDRWQQDSKTKGEVSLLIRRDPVTNAPSDFSILDNGIGFDDENYKSFLTPDSDHHIQKGRKGIGRLGWLKVFDLIQVRSLYADGRRTKSRSFDFVLAKSDQVRNLKDEDASESVLRGTEIQLRGYKADYSGRCPTTTNALAHSVAAHFLPVLVSKALAKVALLDGESTIDLLSYFDGKISHEEQDTVKVDIDGSEAEFTIRHMKCDKALRKDGSHHWLFFTANERSVKELALDTLLGLQGLGDDQIYLASVSGEYLDDHVNQERMDFTWSEEAADTITRAVLTSVRHYLKPYIDRVLDEKAERAAAIINSHPQFIYLRHELKDFVASLPASCTTREQIYVEMSRHRLRRTNRFEGMRHAILTAQSHSEEVEKRVAEYNQYVMAEQKGTLADYVVKRKSLLDVLDRLISFKDGAEKHHLEEAVHKLVCPMRAESSYLEAEDHNLWILDDRLAFFDFFASDKELKAYTDIDSKKEPDLAFFYDSCGAWRQSDSIKDKIVLIEFKRPARDNYSGDDNPWAQVLDYIEKLRAGKKLTDITGKFLGKIPDSTAFHCYVVADLTDSLRRSSRAFTTVETSDGEGLIGFLGSHNAYVEFISYPKLLKDARTRNSVFFDKLGLTA